MSNVQENSLMPAAALAKRLGVTARTVLAWHRQGTIPGRRLSYKVLRFDLSAVLAALEGPKGTSDGGLDR